MLKNRTALVTGSTSGIGLGIAEALARQGANIILNGLGPADEIEELRKRISHECGVAVRYNGADIGKPDAIEAMLNKANAEFGVVDILVNNAGIQHADRGISGRKMGRDYRDQPVGVFSHGSARIARYEAAPMGAHHQHRVRTRAGGLAF